MVFIYSTNPLIQQILSFSLPFISTSSQAIIPTHFDHTPITCVWLNFLHSAQQTIYTSSPITNSLILLIHSPFSKTHSSHQLLPQLDSRKPPSVQICICTILSIHRSVRNSVMTNQVMETTPCWYDVNPRCFPFPFRLPQYESIVTNQPTTREYLMAWWRINNGCCRSSNKCYQQFLSTFLSMIEDHFLGYPFF